MKLKECIIDFNTEDENEIITFKGVKILDVNALREKTTLTVKDTYHYAMAIAVELINNEIYLEHLDYIAQSKNLGELLIEGLKDAVKKIFTREFINKYRFRNHISSYIRFVLYDIETIILEKEEEE